MLVNQNDKKSSFIVYITGGFPDLKTTKELIIALDKAGVDVIEIGVPFSDPVADGPTIQESGFFALQRGVTLKKILKLTKELRGKINAAVVLMGYYNSFLKHGLIKFVTSCKTNGIDGIIIPDLIPEESCVFSKLAKANGLSMVFLVSPNSTEKRIRLAASLSSGFLYCVSVKGITGQRKNIPNIGKYISKVRKITNLPLAVGFGISNNAQAKHFLKSADGVIIGSAVIKVIKDNIKKNAVKKVVRFIKSLRKGV
ncbi:MAG: tryptophan synthase subunit alpha [Candidatus Firestonebacteria bacterium RIFOXYC2_FULL_39_67]|nr:MAG: tryptophan synthase subunit alpha [Candidatus Firestonebacteria bacterium RIFOXYD2_FULL_39_29]OGF53591.1 MAG: tryptophan synthase subunit alpha [Candidatus Firestonebacteria bacterium RIFOXYC2_FULL_39_67]OGF54359.1 MAG: tryptophan synthase subunit alpha [Candidatus Firestonebacteria bacterium RifOxyC12_full_39_7]